MRARVVLAALACSLTPVLPARLRAQGGPPLWEGLRPGPHAIGYRLVYAYDPSRTFTPQSTAADRPVRPGADRARPAARPVPVRLWYPAAPPPGAARMRYGEYVAVRPDSGATPAVARALRERTLAIHHYAARKYASAGGTPVEPADTAGAVERLMATPVEVVRNAAAERGRFPVVVFAGGAFHSTDENTVLWEHLASYGYIVAAFPSVGLGEADLPDDASGLETMARDLEHVIAAVRHVPSADPERLGAVGFSFGGAAALVAAMRNDWIDAVAGLDPSFIARQHLGAIRAAPLYSPQHFRVPLLEMHRADTTVDYGVVDSLRRARRYSVEFSGLDHVDFNSYVLLYRRLMGERARRPAARDSALAVKAAAYVGMVESVRQFLGAFVKGDATQQAALERGLSEGSPRWSSLPPGAVRFRYRAAEAEASPASAPRPRHGEARRQ